MNWREDFIAAAHYATQHARHMAPGCEHRLGCRCEPPHYLRCDYVAEDPTTNELVRCAQGYGHLGNHLPPLQRKSNVVPNT